MEDVLLNQCLTHLLLSNEGKKIFLNKINQKIACLIFVYYMLDLVFDSWIEKKKVKTRKQKQK